MEGKIIYQGKTIKGKDIVIRYLSLNDAESMLDYVNNLSREQTFILFQGEQLTLDYETKYVADLIEKIKNNKNVTLLVFNNNKLIAVSGVHMKERAESHVGILGITVSKEFRGEGIGKLLMQKVLEEAEKNLPQLKIVTLGVFSNNNLAKEMYKKFGFIIYGDLPKSILHKEEYVDHIYMYKKIRD